jgi:hypothetical protein
MILFVICIKAGILYGIGVGSNHFTHIILDEAAQMMEPEVHYSSFCKFFI